MHERAVAIMGPRGIGKSTLAAAFARQNFAVVSDDILVIDQCDEGVMAYPGYSGIRLCPDSVDKVIGKVDGLEPVTSRRNKLFLDLSRAPYSFAARPCLLSGIYFLSPNEQMQTPVCRTTTKAESLFALLANIYPSPLLYGLNKDIESSSFMALGRLVNSITVKELCYKRDLASLEQLCQHLLQDAEQMVR